MINLIGKKNLAWIKMLIEEIKNIKSTKKDLRNFALTIGIVLILIGLFLILFKSKVLLILFFIGTVLILIGYIMPVVLLPFQKLWMIIAVLLGWLSTRIILGLLFYCVITPIKFISKLFGKNFLDLKIDRQQKTYWNYRRKKELNPLDYEKQF
jgi:hypothetical protein